MNDIDFEHMLRDRITQAKNQLEEGIFGDEKSHRTLYTSIHFNSDGKWVVNTWGGNTTDTTTKGAMLFTVVNEHVMIVRRQSTLDELPMRITHQTTTLTEHGDDIPF